MVKNCINFKKTKLTITSHLKSWHTRKYSTYADRNQDPNTGQAQTCGSDELVNIPIIFNIKNFIQRKFAKICLTSKI